jgi:hypothetical protein
MTRFDDCSTTHCEGASSDQAIFGEVAAFDAEREVDTENLERSGAARRVIYPSSTARRVVIHYTIEASTTIALNSRERIKKLFG